MLSRTHGQPATPTTMGKELAVFAWRLERVAAQVEASDFLAKFSGATGTWSAHLAAEPDADWPAISREFIESLGLGFNPLTTQIESHDWQVELYDRIRHAGGILHNLATDAWTYISLGYFSQIPVEGATGSSTMPHKINPIRFENAEANLEISSGLLATLSQTLVTSRLQRDLTDSTTQRNIGVALGHSLLALDNLQRGPRARSPSPRTCCWPTSTATGRCSARRSRRSCAPRSSRGARRSPTRTRCSRSSPAAGASARRSWRSSCAASTSAMRPRTRLLALTPATYTGLASDLVDLLAASRRRAERLGARCCHRMPRHPVDSPSSASSGSSSTGRSICFCTWAGSTASSSSDTISSTAMNATPAAIGRDHADCCSSVAGALLEEAHRHERHDPREQRRRRRRARAAEPAS